MAWQVGRKAWNTFVLLNLLFYVSGFRRHHKHPTTTTPSPYVGSAFEPYFVGTLQNVTIALGREAVFRCLVRQLGGYRIGWINVDTKAIQAIHEHVITHNPRVRVSHVNHNTWKLHIKEVKITDAGRYMCQINTDPMKNQVAHLLVVVPPDFIPEVTSGDVVVSEGQTAALQCDAFGNPKPKISWRREDHKPIVLRDDAGNKQEVSTVHGTELVIYKAIRSDMGVFLCIATNGIPPSISKRIALSVQFHPSIHVPNQLVGAPFGTNVTLECFVEAFPASINYWTINDGNMVQTTNKFKVKILPLSKYQMHMIITIINFAHEDVGSYSCIAKNSIGDVASSIRLYEIADPLKPVTDSTETGHGANISNRILIRGRKKMMATTAATANATAPSASSHLTFSLLVLGLAPLSRLAAALREF